MATTVVNGCNIHYEVHGTGQPIFFTPGGKVGKEIARPVADALSSYFQVVVYDRRNTGASDLIITGEKSEQDLWVDDLAELIKQLGLAPAYVGGWSAGCRISILLAIRYPELVKGLVLGWVTGGVAAAEQLAYNYYGQYIEAAESGGMAAVAATEYFAERIAQNPSNGERLLGMDVKEFIEVMSRWRNFFAQSSDQPVIGATESELASIQAPAMIIAGDDDVHTLKAAQELHRILPNSEFHDPVIARPEWDILQPGAPSELARVRANRSAPIFLRFLEKVEAEQPVAGN